MSALQQLRDHVDNVEWRSIKVLHVALLDETMRMIDLLMRVENDEQLRDIRRNGT